MALKDWKKRKGKNIYVNKDKYIKLNYTYVGRDRQWFWEYNGVIQKDRAITKSQLLKGTVIPYMRTH